MYCAYTPFCVSKQTGCLSFSEVVWLVCRKTACASAVHSTSGFPVANVGTVAPRAEWRLYFRSSSAPRQGKSTPAPPAMILSAFCKNSVDAVSKPSFYFLLRPAFVIGVVILVPAPTGFHVRGLALGGNLVACSMRFQRLAVKPMMRPKVRQHQQRIALQFAAKPLRRRMLLDDPCNTELEHGLQRTVLSPAATAQVTKRIEQTTGRQRGEHHFQAFQVAVFIQRVAV